MQLEQLDRNVTSSGIARQKKMGINMDGTAFRILSDGLYSDKIGSMIRETASNAFDAHVMAGKPDVPIEIGLPTSLAPMWTVRDTGVGLDAEEVLEIATTYFTSTKRQSNAAIGGFGLGFKSPFAKTDQWSITAVKDGVKRVFSAYMDDSGEPNVALLTEESTDEPNGVQIDVPVSRNEASEYERSVVEQLRYFNPRPKVIRGVVDWPEDPDYVFSKDGMFSFSPSSVWNSERHWRVVCGPVSFPLDYSQISYKLCHRQRSLMENSRGILKFNVGDVVPAPSREALQYSQRTVDALVKRIDQALEFARTSSQKKIEEADTFFDACLACKKLATSRFYTSMIEGATWNGRAVCRYIETSQINLGPDNLHKLGTVYGFGTYKLSLKTLAITDGRPFRQFDADTDQILFIDDLDGVHKRQGARVKKYMETVQQTTAIVLRGCKVLDKVLELLDGFPQDQIVYLSTVEPPQVNRTSVAKVGNKSLPGIRKVTRENVLYGSCTTKRDVECLSVPVDDGEEITPGYYIVTEHNFISEQNLNRLRMTEFLPGDVYVVPKSLSSKISEDEGWVSFVDAFEAKTRKESDTLKKLVEQYAVQSASVGYELTACFASLKSKGVTPPSRCVKAFWKLYKLWLSAQDPVDIDHFSYIDAWGLMSHYDSVLGNQKKKVQDLVDKFREESPVVQAAISGFRYSTSTKALSREDFHVELTNHL